MKRFYTAFHLMLLGTCLVGTSANGENSKNQNPREIEIAKIIESCWAISKDDRDSGVTSRMVTGTLATERCLEDHTIKLAKALYSDPQNLEAKFTSPMREARKTYAGFLRNVHMDHDYCKLSCGTIQTIIHAAEMVRFQERVFTKIFKQHWHYVLQR